MTKPGPEANISDTPDLFSSPEVAQLAVEPHTLTSPVTELTWQMLREDIIFRKEREGKSSVSYSVVLEEALGLYFRQDPRYFDYLQEAATRRIAHNHKAEQARAAILKSGE